VLAVLALNSGFTRRFLRNDGQMGGWADGQFLYDFKESKKSFQFSTFNFQWFGGLTTTLSTFNFQLSIVH
jgi:hypothetical protein